MGSGLLSSAGSTWLSCVSGWLLHRSVNTAQPLNKQAWKGSVELLRRSMRSSGTVLVKSHFITALNHSVWKCMYTIYTKTKIISAAIRLPLSGLGIRRKSKMDAHSPAFTVKARAAIKKFETGSQGDAMAVTQPASQQCFCS